MHKPVNRDLLCHPILQIAIFLLSIFFLVRIIRHCNNLNENENEESESLNAAHQTSPVDLFDFSRDLFSPLVGFS